MTSRWGTLEHTADLGLWVEAHSRAGMYEAAAVALSQLMRPGERPVEGLWRAVAVEGADDAELLVAWLGEVVYLADAEGLAVAEAVVESDRPGGVSGRFRLTAPPEADGEPVKAVTYHRASVLLQGDVWRGEVILDV